MEGFCARFACDTVNAFQDEVLHVRRDSWNVSPGGGMPPGFFAAWRPSESGFGSHRRRDDGPQFRSRAVRVWAKSNDIKWQFIQRGCPAQNVYIEQFNGTFHIEVLDACRFESFDQVHVISKQWIPVYNEQRTHGAFGHLPPMERKRRKQLPESLFSTGIE